MSDYVPIDRARTMPGLKLVATPGIPNPWTEAAKGILHVKALDHARIAQIAGEKNEALVAWTGINSAPILIHDGTPPKSGWIEILLLAERLAPEPPLIPADERERATMFGMAHALCSEDGFGWNRRLLFFADAEAALDKLGDSVDRDGFDRMNRKYGHGGDAAHVRARLGSILGMLSAHLLASRDAGSRYYLGDRLTALDIYSATFMAMIRPLPLALCPIGADLHASYTATDPAITGAADDILFAHRDFIYAEYLELPMRL
jgi:glutathione S-transferase